MPAEPSASTLFRKRPIPVDADDIPEVQRGASLELMEFAKSIPDGKGYAIHPGDMAIKLITAQILINRWRKDKKLPPNIDATIRTEKGAKILYIVKRSKSAESETHGQTKER